MNEPSYKVVIENRSALNLKRLKPLAHSWIALLNLHGVKQSTFNDYLDGVVASMRTNALDDARHELAVEKREGHLLNVYMAWDKATYHVTTTYVFSDRTTAILFRLAH